MKKVLFVAYSFPPVGGAGVQRPVKFVKYLREFDWEPVVITVANPSVPTRDETLLKDVPSNVKMYFAKTMEPPYHLKQNMAKKGSNYSRLKSIIKKSIGTLLMPDVQVLWWLGLISNLLSAIKTVKPNCLYVTAPPFSSFVPTVLIGNILNIPVIVDYRDEWSFSRDNWENSVKTNIARQIDNCMERYVLKRAKAITVASPYYKKSLEKVFPFTAGKIKIITNGYDPEDFEQIDFDQPNNKDEMFTIVYTGTVWRATSFAPFLEGIRKMSNDNPTVAAHLKLRIIGRIVEDEAAIIEQLKNYIYVETENYLPHKDIIPEIVAADLLLLTLTELPGAEKIIPGKTFEYLAVPSTILAIIPDGITAEILRNECNVHIVSPNDSEQISSLVISIFKGSRKRVKRVGIDKFSRKCLTKKLALVFDSIAVPR